MNRRQFVVRTGALLIAAGPLFTTSATAKSVFNLPPGRSGGLLGETLPFAKDPFSFLAEHGRLYGPIFRTRLLGRDIVCMTGPESMSQFLDPHNITRVTSQLGHVTKLFGGVNMGQLDGDEHLALRTLALQGFDRRALTAYAPQLDGLVVEALQRWADADEVSAVVQLRKLAIEAICQNILGVAPGEVTDALREDYAKVAAGMISVPVRLPGTTYARAHRARKRIFARLQGIIADRRANPGEDGLSRILAARTDGGRQITDAEMILELHHIVIAGYIVFGLMVELLVQLDRHPDVRTKLLDELDEHGVNANPTLEQLYGLPYMRHVVMEAKRTAAVVPMIFGVAKRDFKVDGYDVPQGWGVWMPVRSCNMDKRVFSTPERFDPARYGGARAEHKRHPHAWMPQGSGPVTGHRCLGLEYSELVCQVFLVHLLRGYSWKIPDQDLTYRYELLPPEPVDGLRVQVRAV